MYTKKNKKCASSIEFLKKNINCTIIILTSIQTIKLPVNNFRKNKLSSSFLFLQCTQKNQGGNLVA